MPICTTLPVILLLLMMRRRRNGVAVQIEPVG
jgi:hypothetical protein